MTEVLRLVTRDKLNANLGKLLHEPLSMFLIRRFDGAASRCEPWLNRRQKTPAHG